MSNKKSVVFSRIACYLIATGIALGAFGAHGLADKLVAKDLEIFEKAVFYHLFHALSLLVINSSTLFKNLVTKNNLRNISLLFIFGILFFSGSLYLLVILQERFLGAITPIGGLSFIIAWVYLALNIKFS